MRQALSVCKSPQLLLALAIGVGPALLLSGCGESKPQSGPITAENTPVSTAKDSMDFFKKNKNGKAVPSNRPMPGYIPGKR